MEVSGHLHAQLLYPWGKSSQYPLVRRLGGHQSWSGHGDEEILSFCWELNPSHPAHSQALYWLCCSFINCFLYYFWTLPLSLISLMASKMCCKCICWNITKICVLALLTSCLDVLTIFKALVYKWISLLSSKLALWSLKVLMLFDLILKLSFVGHAVWMVMCLL